ncbi:glycerophosphodiester phosphodiesterase, partial [Francisella tularensis subsp. holarctica]|nr:glycerophosphodiester phosphodiesterase [Francisella tularensis subsp. holarctica]
YIKTDSATAKLYPNHFGMDNVNMRTLDEVINYVKSTVGSRVRLQIEIKSNPYDLEASWSALEMAEALPTVLLKTGMTDN